MRRYLLGLLVAYAATATLLASNWAVKAWFYRRWFEMLMRGKHGRPVLFHGLSGVARDFGMDLSPWEGLALRFADLPAQLLVVSILLIFALCFGIAALVRVQHPGSPQPLGEDSTDSLRWAKRWTLASLIVGATTFVMTLAFVRWRVLHPHYLPTILLFLALTLAEIIALALCSWRLVRGPRRILALLLMVVAVTPVVLWGCIGGYTWGQWPSRQSCLVCRLRLPRFRFSTPKSVEQAVDDASPEAQFVQSDRHLVRLLGEPDSTMSLGHAALRPFLGLGGLPQVGQGALRGAHEIGTLWTWGFRIPMACVLLWAG
jgi:hypothetical protein